MALIVLRLHPVEPVSGGDFADYLSNLSIDVFDLGINSPQGVLLGTAQFVDPPNTAQPWDPDPATGVAQHFETQLGLPPPPPVAQAVATAVVEIPAAFGPEHETNDLLLQITRGTGTVVHRQVYFNVPVAPGAMPAATGFAGIGVTSLYLALTAPGTELDPTDAFVELPTDGTPPRFDDLRSAVDIVLGNDPGAPPPALRALTPQQAQHVAYEIVWNQKFRPLPGPSGRSLEQMYTAPDQGDDEADRARFEGELRAYYATGDADAERLATFVSALAAAVDGEARTVEAEQVGFRLPALPGATGTGARFTSVRVLLSTPAPPLTPTFTVPAVYFYALGATLPMQVTSEQRYKLATLDEQEGLQTALFGAVDTGVIVEDAGVNIAQAARRLRSLGAVRGTAPDFEIDGASPDQLAVQDLVQAWLGFPGEDILAFWDGPLTQPQLAGHLELVLRALTDDWAPLIAAIKAIPATIAADIDDLPTAQWQSLFGLPGPVQAALLPDFTFPGTEEERVAAFIRHVQKFFAVHTVVPPPGAPALAGPPELRRSTDDPLTLFAGHYHARAGVDLIFGQPFDIGHMLDAVADVFPDDADAREWLEQLIRVVDTLAVLSQGTPSELRFSIMESLYVRGFTRVTQVSALTRDTFREALTGTVAYEHADTIYDEFGGAGPGEETDGAGFRPVNPDDCLVNCVPQPHRSPLGPVAYLHELLALRPTSTCDDPGPDDDGPTLGDLLEGRRGPLGELSVTRANLETPLPLIDLVNESLEAGAPAVHDTDGTVLAGHDLSRHDAATLFAAVPEHSTPATPVAEPGLYTELRADFSAPMLPYAQALDVNRTYLGHLGTSRYDVMRRFRRDITELVLDPLDEPVDFQRHLWRYPVRIDIAREAIGVTPEEYDLLYTTDIADVPAEGQLVLHTLYGFPGADVGDESWLDVVVRLPEFLDRTGLDYCEFLELWRSEFVLFTSAGDEGERPDREFPDCEPCHLDDHVIVFLDPQDPAEALRRLAVFVRLWRTLRGLPGGGYSFTELRDICVVLGLFGADGTIDPDFIRQLAAFQTLRDHFGIALSDPSDPAVPGATGSDRTHLLALWEGTAATKWEWALDELLDQVSGYAQERHGCQCRPPQFLKLLAENLDPLSLLAGFDPTTASDSWSARPTHTLRMAEVLAKIYASDFGVGEVLYLCTADEHLAGDDPFPLQPPNEALASPLDLPDDEIPYSLWDLRRTLLDIEVPDDDVAAWTWPRIETTLRSHFGYAPSVPGPDPFLVLGQHYFPSVVEAAGHPVGIADRQYRVALAGTSALMWNTPPGGPFRYDAAAQELWTELPLTDEAVLEKLARVRQLGQPEQDAVRELYFRPRADLAPFAFVLPNPGEAEERLVQEPDEERRWAYFQRSFALCYARCHAVAEHLAAHVTEWTEREHETGLDGATEVAWRLLAHLFADENRALSSWEDDSGQPPAVTWPDLPSGGAFAALLGLVGTGLLGELTTEEGALTWRETRGPLDAFGPKENAANAPIPTVLPAMDITLTPAQEQFAAVHNGFAVANPEGSALGGAQGYTVRWDGALIVDSDGSYTFAAGAPTADGEEPDFEAADDKRWRVMLRRGQRTWVVLSHDWPDEAAPGDCSTPLPLRRGAYQLTVELGQPQPAFADRDDVCPVVGGFQVKYQGPDTADRLVTIPHERLFVIRTDQPLAHGIDRAQGAAQQFLALHYTSSLRDIRRTYQRAFKAMLLAHRFDLSAAPEADDGQSEVGYLLTHAEDFTGTSYFRSGGGFAVHRAFFDLNLVPLRDNYSAPTAGQDRRVAPRVRRRQAIFDWWERLFDYTIVRRDSRTAPEHPLWLLFHESAENHPNDAAHLLRHLGVDLLHTELVLRYYDGFDVTSADLEDERWTVRVWRAETWIRSLRRAFYEKDVREARPDLWAADDPGVVIAGESESGNENVTRFLRAGCIENGDPRRYLDLKSMNDGLRERGRAALLAFLCGMDRVALPWGGVATEPKHLSELLLLDVEAGPCQRASRIEDAITAVQLFVQRARLGLEPGFVVPAAFALLWDRRFATYRIWEMCRRRALYRENWVDWDELERARRGEAFRFLEAELRRATLTVPVPGGLEYWPDRRPPRHPGVTLLQEREPAQIARIDPAHHGFDILGEPQRHARPSWLAALGLPSHPNGNDDDPRPDDPGEPDDPGGPDDPGEPDGPDVDVLRFARRGGHAVDRLPFWIRAAIRLGTRFLRVAAAAEPPASTRFAQNRPEGQAACCVECDAPHPAVADEYYFWLLDSRTYEEQPQDAGWGWHDPAARPQLLHWGSEPTVQLAWCRVHNGELTQLRRSHDTVRVSAPGPELVFGGRTGDSLRFEVVGAAGPTGHDDPAPPGFRYDLATDTAVALPLVVAPAATVTDFPGDLGSYPYFAYFAPGVEVMPPSLFAPAVAVAASLRTRCQFEAALKWYELYFSPLHADSEWSRCEPDREEPETPPGSTVPIAPPDRRHRGCCHDSTEGSDEDSRQRAIILHYLETLLQWGDAMMRRNTPEAFQHTRLVYDTMARLLGTYPPTVLAADSAGEPEPVADFVADNAPLNPRLLALYERSADRLALIRACLDARRRRNGTPRVDMPYFGDTGLRDGWQTTAQACLDADDWCAPHSCYRFVFLVQKAQELANDVRALGAALLAAYEKGDAEHLASMRATHERQLLSLTLEIRQDQWRQADWQVQALGKTKEIAQTRERYYTLLIENALNNREEEHEALVVASTAVRAAGNISEGIAQVMSAVPDFFPGFPSSLTWIPLGTKLSGVFTAVARIAGSVAEIATSTGGLRLTQAGWERREEEWRHQVEVLDLEIEQIERQILASDRGRDVALRELTDQQRSLEQSSELHDFLRDKLTGHGLYLWLQQETAALHHQSYELALHVARQAQRAFNYERGHTAHTFITEDGWDGLRDGLQAGDRLSLALRQMEHAYLDSNCREYELTKHLSLRLHFPVEFLRLQATGSCEIDVPEWMFDHDYPGHYLRRIKNVALTIPCVVGPYTGVHSRLTLLSSRTRVHPHLADPPHLCCADGGVGNGYEERPDDPRVVRQYAATEAIATSSGQNDAGMFELSFRDERYLPFEFAGAVSRWRIELPPENNYFDIDSVADVVLHLSYTAREGGDILRRAAHEIARRTLPGAGIRYIDVEHDLPDAWHLFQRPPSAGGEGRDLEVRLHRAMFPYLPYEADVRITQIELFFDAPGATPSAHHTVQFRTTPSVAGHGDGGGEPDDCETRRVECIASADWPELFHGVVDEVDVGALQHSGGMTFCFPACAGTVSRVFMFCQYELG